MKLRVKDDIEYDINTHVNLVSGSVWQWANVHVI